MAFYKFIIKEAFMEILVKPDSEAVQKDEKDEKDLSIYAYEWPPCGGTYG
jgi:hypothetical protein